MLFKRRNMLRSVALFACLGIFLLAGVIHSEEDDTLAIDLTYDDNDLNHHYELDKEAYDEADLQFSQLKRGLPHHVNFDNFKPNKFRPEMIGLKQGPFGGHYAIDPHSDTKYIPFVVYVKTTRCICGSSGDEMGDTEEE